MAIEKKSAEERQRDQQLQWRVDIQEQIERSKNPLHVEALMFMYTFVCAGVHPSVALTAWTQTKYAQPLTFQQPTPQGIVQN